MKKKRSEGRLAIPGTETYYKATEIKTLWKQNSRKWTSGNE